MRYSNVPALGVRYWTAISLASIAGCNLGDFVSLYLHWGHRAGLCPLALIFAVLLVGERRSTRTTEAWYWAVVIVLRTAATNVADLATHTFAWPYSWVMLGLTVVLVALVLPVAPRQVDTDSGGAVARPSTDGWYWASLLTAGTLGTAIGDWVAEELNFGTAVGTLVLGAITAVVLIAGRRSGWSTRASYWLGIVAVRSAGTTAGDYLAFKPGVDLGLLASTSLTCALFVVTLIAWRDQRVSLSHQRQ
jgi:uncharacterized membrane-anchored protein